MSFVYNAIEEAVRDVYATRYASLAASSIIIYDHLITLDNEFDLIWKSPWSIGKGLFIIVYGRFEESLLLLGFRRCQQLRSFRNNPYEFCLQFYHWQGWTGLIACMIAETILQMRLYALYFLNKRILYLMVGSFILTSASAATIMSIGVNQFHAEAHLLPGLPCLVFNVPSYFYSFWIPILAFETLLCILALVRGFRTHGDSGYPVSSDSGKRLVSLLIKDSVCYYVIMFTTYLTCLLVWVININLLEVPIGFSVAFSCVLGNRVIFNVRKVNQKMEDDNESTTHRRHGKENTSDHEEQEFDTLTDFEMAQLRSLRVEVEPIQGANLVI